MQPQCICSCDSYRPLSCATYNVYDASHCIKMQRVSVCHTMNIAKHG
uniref:Uncharacterized protein n=1 Tax=Arundo donax TaxID=35708 RepID=A0A0A9HSE2_ARUDO